MLGSGECAVCLWGVAYCCEGDGATECQLVEWQHIQCQYIYIYNYNQLVSGASVGFRY